MTTPSLLDVAKANLADDEVGLIEEAVIAVPEISLFPARTIRGLNYYTRVRKTLPTAGFRNANEGVTPSKSESENRLVETFILNPRWECDKAVADRDERGPGAFIAEEALGIVLASFQTVAKQIYYGTGAGGDAKGFPGFLASYDSANMLVDAEGAAAAAASSVWAVKFGPQAVRMVAGMNGSMDMSDLRIETIRDANNKALTGYVQELLAYPGLQVGSLDCLGRIKNLTEEAGKGLTDDLLADLVAKFKVGMKPDVLLASRRSIKQLKKSRTATNPTGAPAPTPTDYEGIPIVATDAILDTEAIDL